MFYNINFFLFRILGAFIFFDSLVLKSIFGDLSKIRTIAYLLLFINCFIYKKDIHGRHNHEKRNFNTIEILYYTYIIIVGLFSFNDFINGGVEGFMIYKQLLLFPLFVYIYSNFEELTKVKITKYFNYLVNCAVAWVIINTFLFFVEFPIWINFRPWVGRISNGYPTVDVVCLGYALMLSLFVKDLGISANRRALNIVVILMGMIVQFSGTGIAIILSEILLYIFLSISKQVKGLKYSFYLSMITIIMTANIAFSIFYVKERVVAESAIKTLTNKMTYIFGDKSELSIYGDTMQMREDQFEVAKKRFQKTMTSRLFGVGYGKVVMINGGSSNPNGIFVEDQYALAVVSMGYLGVVLFVLYICFPLYYNISGRRIHNKRILYGIGLLSVIIFLLSSKTVLTMAIFQLQVVFSIFYALLLSPNKFAKIE